MSILTILVFLSIVTVLVAAHELGHYLFARLFKMGVEEFAVGFGKKPIWTFAKRTYDTPNGPETTVFTIRPWPLGGFVRIKGMAPEEDAAETKIAGGFYSKAPFQRFVVLLAGPLFSVLAGLVILIPLYMVQGIPKPSNEPVIGMMAADGAAAKAGLLPGDRIVSIDGTKINTFYQAITIIRENAGKPLAFTYARKDDLRTALVTPLADPEPTDVLGADLEPTGQKKVQGKMGARFEVKYVPMGFTTAFGHAIQAPVEMVKSLAGVITLRKKASDELGGPMTMIAATSETVKRGLGDTLALAGLLSISLGIFNLLPIPPFDGGQMVIAVVEMLRKGRRLSLKVQERVAAIGLALIGVLIVSVFVIDFKRFFGAQPETTKVTAPSR